MAPPKGFVESLGGDEGPESSEPSATADESMLEQHLRALKRALDSGNMKSAASCFRAAMMECDNEEPEEESEGEEEY